MGYGALWFMVCISPPTKSVDRLSYGISQVMGFHKYGLRQVRLYLFLLPHFAIEGATISTTTTTTVRLNDIPIR